MSSPSLHLPVPPPQPAPQSYRLAAVDALRRGDRDVYRVLSSQPGVGANPLIPKVAEVKDTMKEYSPFRTCLDMCATTGLTDAVETVLGGMSPAERETGVDVEDEDGATALWYAASNNHTDIVRMLCETGCVEVDKVRHHQGGKKQDSTPLMAAARKAGSAATLSVLLSFGADPNYRRRYINSARDDSSVLEVLCRVQRRRGRPTSVDSVRVLLESGANPDSHPTMWRNNQHDASALMQSVEEPEVVQVLVEYGADVNYRSSWHMGGVDDSTVLHVASCRGYPLSVRLLCEAGADVQATTTHGNGFRQRGTPLEVGIFGYVRPVATVAVLLSTGRADPFASHHQDDDRLLIDTAHRRNASLCLLMDSRPYLYAD